MYRLTSLCSHHIFCLRCFVYEIEIYCQHIVIQLWFFLVWFSLPGTALTMVVVVMVKVLFLLLVIFFGFALQILVFFSLAHAVFRIHSSFWFIIFVISHELMLLLTMIRYDSWCVALLLSVSRSLVHFLHLLDTSNRSTGWDGCENDWDREGKMRAATAYNITLTVDHTEPARAHLHDILYIIFSKWWGSFSLQLFVFMV